MVDTPNFSNRITILTLIGYFLGLIILKNAYLSILLLIALILLLTKIKRLQLFYQRPIILIQFILTTFTFGLIHAFTCKSVLNFRQQKQSVWPLFQIYLSFMCVYYYFQFQLNNCFHHTELNWYSFLIYHSKQYMIANIFSITEHILTKYIFAFGYKNGHMFIYPVLIVMILGEGLRIMAFFTAKSNFSHLVKQKKDPSHQLITHGVYSFFRHPGYTGYFYFSVSSQIFLGNWISAVGFFIVLCKFFNQRIQREQYSLTDFFKQQYLQYKKKTHILIPFVKDLSSQEFIKEQIKKQKSS